MRGARREGGTGVTAINSSPIGPPLILLRSYAFFPFLLSLSLSVFLSSTPPPHPFRANRPGTRALFP